MNEKIKENEEYQSFIQKGPGWTDAQNHQKDLLTQEIEAKQNQHGLTQNDLFNIRQRIEHTETKILELEASRDKAIADHREVENKIEEANREYFAKQSRINGAENQIEALTLELQDYQEQLRYNNDSIEGAKQDSKRIAQSTKDAQLEIEKCGRELKEYDRRKVVVSAELERQHQKNLELETENAQNLKLIEEINNEAIGFEKEAEVSEKKKDIMSDKIAEVETIRIECEKERDSLKLQLNKVGGAELKMIAQEMEAQKRQMESLQREKGLLERKKALTEKSSSLVKDIIASNVSTLKNLNNEIEAFSAIAKRREKEIDELKRSLEKEREGSEIASKKRKDALNKLVEQELQIEEMQKKLKRAEAMRRQKQSLCDSVKAECNLETKRLAENCNELESAKKEMGLIRREMKTLKVQILSTESNTVMEHYNHHHTDEEKNALKKDVDNLRQQMIIMDQSIERNNDELQKLGQMIAGKDKECDKYTKEYNTHASNRDVLGSLLVQKNTELEKIREKIKGQQSVLHHGELQHTEMVSSIGGYVTKLKELLMKKDAFVELETVHNDLLIEVHVLENEIHCNKLKTVALRDELSRPVNIHRWRSLEHRNPQKYDKIKRIHRLQKQMIATAEQMTEKDVCIREEERIYAELQRISSHQPHLSEVEEQLKIYQANLSEKLAQMKDIEFELDVQKRRVCDLNEDLKTLECEGKNIQDEWIEGAKVKESLV